MTGTARYAQDQREAFLFREIQARKLMVNVGEDYATVFRDGAYARGKTLEEAMDNFLATCPKQEAESVVKQQNNKGQNEEDKLRTSAVR